MRNNSIYFPFICSSPNLNYTSAYYPPSSQVLPKTFVGTTTLSPWEREEREKETELRREQARQWREHHIIELSNASHRSQQQDEQLKTLILERDFERLAQEQGDMEEDNDTNYGKDNMQEDSTCTKFQSAINASDKHETGRCEDKYRFAAIIRWTKCQ